MSSDSRELEVLTIVANDMEGAIIVNALEQFDIRAIATGGYTSGFQAEAPGNVKVQVARSDLKKARQALEQLRGMRQPPIPVDTLRRNIELKARIGSLAEARQIATAIASKHVGMEHQLDTYFNSPHGRLKLREINGETAQLIWYSRSDQRQARQSEYYLLDIADPETAKGLLAAAMGVRREVMKDREIFLYQNVRIHLDQVRGLGEFIEFEAVLGPDAGPELGQDQISWLCEQFHVAADDISAGSYVDLQSP